jgi:hypothetical protein
MPAAASPSPTKSYIIVLREDVEPTELRTIQPQHEFRLALNGFAAELSASDGAALS